MVDLKDFVRESILDVMKGIAEARADSTVGGQVAPVIRDHANIDPSFGVAWHAGAMWSVMKFDIAITASTTTEAGAGAKAKFNVAVFQGSLGGDGKIGGHDETVSRVQFQVHCRLSQE